MKDEKLCPSSSHEITIMDEKKYPEPKDRELSDQEKQQIRERIQNGQDNIYELAQEFGCSSSQIAGIKAAMTRTG